MDQIKKEYRKDVDYMRVRAYPFAHEIHDFVASHERVYVVEQNRDAQMASLLKQEYRKDVDYMRVRAYPFAHEIHDFVASHERVYVVEQNRDAQMASLLKQ